MAERVNEGNAPPAPISPRTTRRNIAASAANSFFVEAAMTLSEGNMVLTLFVRALGGSSFLVGLLPSLQRVGWLVPQFFAAGGLQRLSRFLPAVQGAEVIRSSFYVVIAVLAFLFGRSSPHLVLVAFFILYLPTRVAAGVSAVARAEIVARMVPPRERPTLISVRQFTGGIAGFASGFLVRYILDARVSRFPDNYATLIGLSGISFALAIAAISLIREPRLPIKPRRVAWLQQIKRAPGLLKADRRYALYVGECAAAAGMELATPFYILYATEVLGAPAAMAGVYISLRTFAQVISNMFWGRQCRMCGNLAVLKTACILGIVAPMTVILLPWAISVIWPGQVPPVAMWLLGGVFLMQGLAGSARGISELSYLYDIAPEHDRPTYYGLTNTLVGPLHFLSALAGALLDAIGYLPIFATAAALAGVAFALACRLARRERAFGDTQAHSCAAE